MASPPFNRTFAFNRRHLWIMPKWAAQHSHTQAHTFDTKPFVILHTFLVLTLCSTVSISVLSFRFSEDECLKSLFIDQIKWNAIKTSMPSNGNEGTTLQIIPKNIAHSIAEHPLVMAYRTQAYSMPKCKVDTLVCHWLYERHNKAAPFNY